MVKRSSTYEAWQTVDRHCAATDEKTLNATGVEFGKQIFEVAVDGHPIPSTPDARAPGPTLLPTAFPGGRAARTRGRRSRRPRAAAGGELQRSGGAAPL